MMKRRAIPIALLALGALSLGVAEAEIVGDFPEVVIFGGSSVQVNQNVTVVTGDVVANQAGATMSLGNKVTTNGEVKADILSIGNFLNLNGPVLCNNPSGGVVCAALAPLPVYGPLPVFQPYLGSGVPVNVPNGGTHPGLPPGDYGDLTVGVEGTITFVGPGDFNFTSFTAGRKGQLIFTGGPIEIRVAGNFSTGVEDNINLAESPVAASDIAIYVGGNAEIGAKTNVNANFYVQGLLEIGSNVIAKGAYLATQIVVGQKSQFTLSTFWDYQPCQTEAPGTCDDSATTDEDTDVTVDVLANDTDFEGDNIFVNSVTDGANGSVSFTASDVTYTPDPDYFGTDSFTYEVCDEDTKVNEDNCVDIDVTVTVTSVNDPPVTTPDSAEMDEDGGTITIDVVANDTAGPDNEDQTKLLTELEGSGNSHVKISGNQVEYTPNADYFGTDTFGYTVCDDGDGADDDTELCSLGTVTVTVNAVNDAPVADAQSASTNGDVNVDITLTGSDIDGDALAFSITVDPTEGQIVGTPTQLTPTSARVTYDPFTDLDKPDQFTFEVDDGNGGTATAFVSINPFEGCIDDNDCLEGFVCNTSVGVCEAEVPGQILANADEVETTTGDDVEIIVSASAPDPIDDLVFTIDSGPTSGSLSPVPPTPIVPVDTPIRSAKTTYSPVCTPSGDPPVCSASFVFKACEVAVPLNCATATVTINVAPLAVAQPPVAEDISATTGVGESVVIDLTGGGEAEEAPEGRQCTQDSDCDVGHVCTSGACVPE